MKSVEELEGVKIAGIELKELGVNGGTTANESHLQFQADILGIPVLRCATSETTALGTAYRAGLAIGYWKDILEIKSHWGPRQNVLSENGTFRCFSDAEKME